MATTTHPAPSFDITAADDMDLHSDNDGLEYNDGDIELDLEPPSYGPDDDVSIDDAVSANGMETQGAPSGDNDDYMVDQEDVIEEDYSYQDVDVDTGAEQPAVADAITTEAQVEVEVQDEDLLDYSEDDDNYHDPALRSPWLQQHHDSMEDEPDQTQDVSTQHDETVETQDAPTEQGEAYEVQDTNIQQDEIPADLQALMSMNTNRNSQSPQAHTDVVADDSLNATNDEHLPPSESVSSPEGDAQAHDDEGGVLLKPQEEHESTESGHNDISNTIHDHNESAQDSEPQEDASFQLPPVTVNCMGEELWLFKQHDYENSGDWLLQDSSVARTSMSDLFQACRSALGHEVLNGMEIGFRFDHFQNMELFEDSTASVAVSLERLVGYYHMLYAQDGNNEPDSFYITLMYRPRFATLLADIARYADDGRGYSGFEAAIAAGETNFHSASLGLPVEETAEWETEGQEPEQEHDQGQVDDDEHESEHESKDEVEEDASEQTHEDANEEANEEGSSEEKNEDDLVQQNTEVEAHTEDQVEAKQQEQTYEEAQIDENREPESNDHQGDDAQDAHEEGGVDVHEVEEAVAEDASDEAHDQHNNEEQPLSSYEVSANAQEVADEPKQTQSQPEDQTAAELEARRLQQEGDIIDYSDGEDEESATVEETEQAPRTQLSPSPVTVQGDESTGVEQQFHVGLAPSEDHGVSSFDSAEERYIDESIDGDNDPNESAEYWAFIEATEDREATEESGDDDVALNRQGDADQGYGFYEYQDLEQHVEGEVEFTNEVEAHGGEDATTGGSDFTGANDILDTDHGQWAVNPEIGQDAVEETATTYEDDHVDIPDEEDGVAEHIANVTSSAADPTTASSTEAHEVSGQGHKRSIDEVGHGVDIAPDSIDAKRARV